jgi:hypothetical protein
MANAEDSLDKIAARMRALFVPAYLTSTPGGAVNQVEFEQCNALFEKLLKIVDALDKRRRFYFAWDKDVIEDHSWFHNVGEFMLTYTGGFMEEENIKPYSRKSLMESGDPQLEKIMTILDEANSISGFLSSNLTTLRSRIVYGERFLTNPIVRKFKAYLREISNNYAIETHRDFPSGVVKVMVEDVMYGQRLKLTNICVGEMLRPNLPVPPEVIEEVWEYLFRTLADGVANIKKWKSPILECWGTKSTTGFILEWDAELTVPKKVPKIAKNSGFVYELMKDEMLKAYKEMKEAGLPKLARLMKDGITKEMGDESCAQLSWLSFVEALFGYQRDNYVATFERQFRESVQHYEDINGDDFVPGFSEICIENWRKCFASWKQPKESEFRAKLLGDMTTKSNGLLPDIDESVTGHKIDNQIESVNTVIDGKPGPDGVPKPITVNVKLSNKTTTYIHDPMKVHLHPLDKLYTLENPGKIGMRTVPSRRRRPICQGTIYSHKAEALFENHLADFTGKWKLGDFSAGTEYNVTTTEVSVGRQLTEHKYWHGKSSQRGVGPYNRGPSLICRSDFDALDQHSGFHIRQLCIVAMVMTFGVSDEFYNKNEVIRKTLDKWGIKPGSNNLVVQIVDGRPAHEWVLDFWSHVKDAVFIIPDGKDRSKDYIVVRLNMLLSGEYMTRYFNDMTTFSYLMYVESKLKRFHVDMWIERLSVQGDDTIEVRTMSHRLLNMSDVEMAAFCKEYAQARSDLATECGLKLNPLKFGFSDSYYEYLKKAGMCGWVIPRAMQTVVGIYESERIDRTEDPLTRMRARVSQYREAMFRGTDFITTMMMLYTDWTFIRKVKFGPGISADIPFEVLFTPLSSGGIGLLPWTIIDPNVDILIQSIEYPYRAQLIIQEWSKAYKMYNDSSLTTIARGLTTEFEKGIKWIDQYTDRDVLRKANDSYNWLLERGYRDNATYADRAKKTIEETVQDMPQLRKVRIFDKRKNMRKMIEHVSNAAKSGVVLDMRKNIHKLQFIELEQMTPVIDAIPIAGWDPAIAHFGNCFGYSANGNTLAVDVFKELRRLINRSSMPKNLSANLADALARTIIDNNLTDQDAIYHLFLSRGAGDEEKLAASTAQNVASRIHQLKFVKDVSSYSIVGEGFVDKSLGNILRKVEVAFYENPTDPVSTLLYILGFLKARNMPLLTKVNGEYTVRTPRRVRVVPTDGFISEDLVNKYKQSSEAMLFTHWTPSRDYE